MDKISPFLEKYTNANDAKFLIHGFQHGFPLGYAGPRIYRDSKNLKSVIDNIDIAKQKIYDEIDAGRMSGPDATRPISNLRCSPIGLVPKKSGGFRLITHMSHPASDSVNDYIDPMLTSVKYSDFDNAVKMIKRLGKGTLMEKMDLKSAFRILPCYPGDFDLLGIMLDDYIPDDNLFHIFGTVDYDGSYFNTPRRSKDSIRGNNYGKFLVNLCCLFDIHILNGRFEGDIDGNFTCFSNDGASLVDYMIASSNLFSYIRNFCVLDRDDSDHFPLSCELALIKKPVLNMRGNDVEPLTPIKRYKWNQSHMLSFIDNFKSTLQNISHSLSNTVCNDVNTGVKAITSLYHEAGQCMLVKNMSGRFSSQPPWWNSTCDNLKYIKYRALRKFRESNSLLDLRIFKDKRNEFKNYCRIMLLQYQFSNRNMLLASSNDPSSFWKILKRGKTSRALDISISPSEWYQYFAGLLYDENAVAIDQPSDNYIDPSASVLNEPFTLDEILRSIANLSVGKCSGIDGIPAEFFKTTMDDIAPIFLALFNHIFLTGNIPLSWRSSAITPVYKSGPSNIPGNYRGISITNTMYKIFSGVINKRLYDWAEENNKIDESQAGFRKGYSAVDNIFRLQSMVQKYLSKKCGRFYCIYVDFRKAFDKINHNRLFVSLEKKGIHGQFMNTLKSLYTDLKSCVKLNNNVTDFFSCNIGTRQGDKTSSTIFDLFIDELSVLLRENCDSGIFITNDIPDIFCLMFADDVAGCAETAFKL
ncbi:uncharacterized protein LOC132721934 [Ruditapes philippinarum]|uniref:uncharacterized protein LOC132721934 n=1 Tax=Ruditapes philippinarum TaxID=129788 RepID=UPI00295AC8B8|nr:uncharacterized protein LOC132721934 [Ruditapes philippinarum]